MTNNDTDGWNLKPSNWEYFGELKNSIKKLSDNHIQTDENYYDKYNNIDTIFVLAGGFDKNNSIHEWVIRRLNLAYDIYNFNKNIKIICLGGGTYHKPPVMNDQGYVIHESTACAEYLINLGVPSNNIYKEWGSYDTIANGFFAYTNYILPMNCKNILIITSDFHMPRSKFIFNWIVKKLNDNNINLYYESVTDKGIDSEIINCRTKREKNSLNNLKYKVAPSIKSFSDFHEWMFTHHKVYSVEPYENDHIDSATKNSY